MKEEDDVITYEDPAWFKRRLEFALVKIIETKQNLTLSHTSPGFMCLQYKSFKNIKGKGEIAHDKQFLLFPQCFPPYLEKLLPCSSNLKLSSANSFQIGSV